MKKNSIYQTIMSRLFLDFFSRGSFFVLNILIARALTVSSYGVFSYAISLTAAFYIFTDLGIHMQLIKELGQAREGNRDLWKGYFELKLVLMGVCLVVFSALSAWLWHWQHPWIMVLALVWMFCNSLSDFYQFICNGLGRLDLARPIMLLQRILPFATMLVCVWLWPTVNAILIGLAISGTVGSVLSILYFNRATGATNQFAWDHREWKRIFKASIPNGVSGAFGLWYLRIAPVVLGWLWSSHEIGEYSAAYRVFEATYIIPTAIICVSVPHLSGSFVEGKKIFLTEFKRVSKAMIIGGLLWAAFLVASSSLIVDVLLGHKYHASVGILKILGGVSLMVFLNYLVTHLMVVVNQQGRHAVHQGIAFAVSVVLNIVLIQKYGGVGAAVALFLTEFVLFVLTTSFLIRIKTFSSAHEGTVCA